MKSCRNRKCRALNSDDALFCTACGAAFPPPDRKAKVVAWLFGILSLMLLALVGYEEYRLWLLRSQLSDEQATTEAATKRESAQRDSLVSRIDALEQQIIDSSHSFNDYRNEVAHYYPLVVRGIEVANVNRMREIIDNFGEPLIASRVEFLQPRLRYKGLTHGGVDLLVRWILPDGSIRRMPDAPEGFSQLNADAFIYPEEKELYLQGMGSQTPGTWPRGTYRLEIWHNDILLGSRNVVLH